MKNDGGLIYPSNRDSTFVGSPPINEPGMTYHQ